MRRLNPLDCDDSYGIKSPRNSLQDHLSHSACLHARRSTSQQRAYEPHFLGSQSAIRKQQPLYRFSPLNDSYASAPSYASNEVDPEEPQLPHYVVPVLYVPQRIITNEELISSEIYDQLGQDNPYGKVIPGRPSTSSRRLPSFQNRRCDQVCRDDAMSSPEGSRSRLDTHPRLTDSESEIYDKLMEKLYGFRSREAEKGLHGDCSTSASRVTQDYVGGVIPAAEPDHHNSVFNCASDSDNPSTCTPGSTRRRAPSPLKASSFVQEYATRILPPCSPTTSAYTVHPATPADFRHHRPVKDYRTASNSTSTNDRGMLGQAKTRHCESRAKSPPTSQTAAPERVLFDTDLTSQGEGFESKFTQTAADISTTTQSGDHGASKKPCGCIHVPEKGPTKKRKEKCPNCNGTDVTVVIDTGWKEDVYTVLDGGLQYPEELEKSIKSIESIPTVDLLPVESSLFEPLKGSIKTVPKLRTQSRFSSPNSVPLQR